MAFSILQFYKCCYWYCPLVHLFTLGLTFKGKDIFLGYCLVSNMPISVKWKIPNDQTIDKQQPKIPCVGGCSYWLLVISTINRSQHLLIWRNRVEPPSQCSHQRKAPNLAKKRPIIRTSCKQILCWFYNFPIFLTSWKWPYTCMVWPFCSVYVLHYPQYTKNFQWRQGTTHIVTLLKSRLVRTF